MRRRLRVLALATYPIEAAASRYRIVQFIKPLAARGIDVTFSPFLDTPLFDVLYEPRRLFLRLPRLIWRLLRRLGDVVRASRADVVWIQREAMLFGPPVIEWLIARVLRKPVVLDLDDPTYVPYVSPIYGRFATWLKWPSKADTLIRWSRAVIAGSKTVADYAGPKSVIVPTIVDLDVFKPGGAAGSQPAVIGWIGTHGTFPYLEPILPVLAKLAREHDFRLRIIGSGCTSVDVPRAELKLWRLEDELADLQSFDVGLYPITEDRWSVGKSGFKAVQYMAIGVPFVMSPVGVSASIGMDGSTHFLARTPDEWYERLSALLGDAALRRSMGQAARKFAEEHYGVEQHAGRVAEVLIAAAPA
jgi:glycosyltransferase involved in cell wall biosynthesis